MIGFGDVIAPLTAADISALRRNRTLKYQGDEAGRARTPLLDWATMWDLIVAGTIPIAQCRVTYGRQTIPTEFYLDEGTLNATRLGELIARDVSLLANGVEIHAPTVAAACRDAATQGVRIAGAGAIVTTGRGGALPLHHDDRDIIVLQMEGTNAGAYTISTRSSRPLTTSRLCDRRHRRSLTRVCGRATSYTCLPAIGMNAKTRRRAHCMWVCS